MKLRPGFCSKCGGELDAEGWCANYCMDSDPSIADKSPVCNGCGQLTGIDSYDEKLWDIYYRIDDGRQYYEPLVFYSDWLEENVVDEEDFQSVNHAMEKDMVNRGLCPTCSRPNLRGVDPSKILSEEDAQAQAEMEAEMAAERRMGC